MFGNHFFVAHSAAICTIRRNLRRMGSRLIGDVSRGDPRGGRVYAYRVFDVPAVSTRYRHRDRQTDLANLLQHEGVATGEPGERQRETAKPVALVGIGTGEIDHHVGARGRNCPGQHAEKQLEVFVVTGAVVQLDVDTSGDFVERVVLSAMHAEGEHALVAGE